MTELLQELEQKLAALPQAEQAQWVSHFLEELSTETSAADGNAEDEGEGQWIGGRKPTLEEVKDAKRVKIEVEQTDEQCPECKKGNLVVRTGKFGKFLSCSRFPDCKFTKPLVEDTKLICPKDSICIDIFAGSGTTLMACKSEGVHFIGIDQSEEYCEIAQKRIDSTVYQPDLLEVRGAKK